MQLPYNQMLAFLICADMTSDSEIPSLTVRFSCGPASVTLAAHVSARRGRQLQPVLGQAQAPDLQNDERRL
jgi:hypothetical protein